MTGPESIPAAGQTSSSPVKPQNPVKKKATTTTSTIEFRQTTTTATYEETGHSANVAHNAGEGVFDIASNASSQNIDNQPGKTDEAKGSQASEPQKADGKKPATKTAKSEPLPKGLAVEKGVKKEDVDGRLSEKELATLIKYGFSDKQIGQLERNGFIEGARVHVNPQTEEKELWLTFKNQECYANDEEASSTSDYESYPSGTYRLELPINNNFDPSKISCTNRLDTRKQKIYTCFNNVKGNCVFLESAKGQPGKGIETEPVVFSGNSKVNIQGLNGSRDTVIFEHPAVGTFSTGDWADKVIGVSNKKNDFEYNLKPGKTEFVNKPVK